MKCILKRFFEGIYRAISEAIQGFPSRDFGEISGEIFLSRKDFINVSICGRNFGTNLGGISNALLGKRGNSKRVIGFLFHCRNF